MASGLEGQRFAFCGYLPRETDRAEETHQGSSRAARGAKRKPRSSSRRPTATTPCFARCSRPAPETTQLCVAADLTLPGETIRTQTIAAWRRKPAPPGKRPAVFLLLAQDR